MEHVIVQWKFGGAYWSMQLGQQINGKTLTNYKARWMPPDVNSPRLCYPVIKMSLAKCYETSLVQLLMLNSWQIKPLTRE